MAGRYSWRPAIENSLVFDIAKLKASGLIVPQTQSTGCWGWWRDEKQVASVGYQIHLGVFDGRCHLRYQTASHGAVDCRISLNTTPLPWGGLRWWLICPYSGKRAAKLYKFDGIEKFCHREAIRPLPTYASQRVSKGLDRVTDQRWRLRRRMGDNVSSLLDPVVRPKGMHWKTFLRYAQEEDRLAALDREHWVAQLASVTGESADKVLADLSVDLGI